MLLSLLNTLGLLTSVILYDLGAGDIRWTRTHPAESKTIVFQPHSKGQVLYAALEDSIGGLFVSRDGGYTWRKAIGRDSALIPTSKAYIRQIHVLSSDTNIVFAGSSQTAFGVSRSTDGGYNWQQVIFDATILGESIFETPDGSGRLYCGNSGLTTLWMSDDKGKTWSEVSTIDAGSPNICVIAPQPGTTNVFLVGTGGGSISRSVDAGKTWFQTHAPEEFGFSDVPMILFDPVDPDNVFATLYNYKGRSFIKSDDGGRSWRNIPHRRNLWALEIDAANPERMWTGRFTALDTNGGSFFQSTDAGETWEDLGLDSVINIWQMEYDTTTGRIAMATSNGIFIGETRNSAVQEVSSADHFDIWPLPAAGTLQIRAEIEAEMWITDVEGKKLLTQNIVQGESKIDVAGFSAGVYFAHLRHKNGYVIKRIMLVR